MVDSNLLHTFASSKKKNKMSNYIAQLGKIENGKDKVVVFATEEGFKLVFTSNGIRKECDLLDSDHVARELEYLGYSESYIDVILSML